MEKQIQVNDANLHQKFRVVNKADLNKVAI